jgi:hypothetical protein
MSCVCSVPWDLEAPTNVIILERALSELPQPHPETETLRASFATKLRGGYQELCHAREGKSLQLKLEILSFKIEAREKRPQILSCFLLMWSIADIVYAVTLNNQLKIPPPLIKIKKKKPKNN